MRFLFLFFTDEQRRKKNFTCDVNVCLNRFYSSDTSPGVGEKSFSFSQTRKLSKKFQGKNETTSMVQVHKKKKFGFPR